MDEQSGRCTNVNRIVIFREAQAAMAVVVVTAFFSCASVATAQVNDSAYDYFQVDEADILTRGPVHEAFAEPVVFDPDAGIAVPSAPPEPIDEYPPNERPVGMNVTWIPGYWAWDDDMNDYLWISGIWRDVPPGREWIAGYWGRSHQGYQWISGYWDNVDSVQTMYLPEPPQYIDAQPAMAPSPDQVWIPGCWVWHQNRYGWRPGYWLQGRPDWVWVPACYTWTPRGYIFVEGYWDHEVERRGVLFAPVRMRSRYYSRPNFRYTPVMAIDTVVFTDHLFLRTSYNHYYFGDYYEERYANVGYRPWFTSRASRRCYDPIYVHRRWEHRNERDWDDRLRRDFQQRRGDRNFRPPQTWADQRRYRNVHRNDRYDRNDRNDRNDRGTGPRVSMLGKTFTQLVNRKQGPMQFQRIDDQERGRMSEHRNDMQRMRDHRRTAESRKDNDPRPDQRYITRTKPARVNRIGSPIRSSPGKDLKGDKNPPQLHKPPKVDDKVQPKKRERVVRKSADRPNIRRGDDDKNNGRDNDRDRTKDKGKDDNRGGRDRDREKD